MKFLTPTRMSTVLSKVVSGVLANLAASDVLKLDYEIARGAFGQVYKGVYLPDNQDMALKIVQPDDEEAASLMKEVNVQ